LGQAFAAPERVVLLIDEVDKADLEFPNDLLHELDRMRFRIMETDEEVVARHRPVVIITSNNEKELPDAFLRRCVFHFIAFPDADLMRRIVDVHHPGLDEALADRALRTFYALRDHQRLRKRPSTSELIDWIAILRDRGVRPEQLEKELPFVGALLKREQDLMTVAQAFSGGRRTLACGGTGDVLRLPGGAATAQGSGGRARGGRAGRCARGGPPSGLTGRLPPCRPGAAGAFGDAAGCVRARLRPPFPGCRDAGPGADRRPVGVAEGGPRARGGLERG